MDNKKNNEAKHKLIAFVNENISAIGKLFEVTEPDILAIDVCRSIDYHSVLPLPANKSVRSEAETKFDQIKRGFPLLLNAFYKSEYLGSGVPLIPFLTDWEKIIDGSLTFAGKLSIVRQLIDQDNANLIRLEGIDAETFEIKYLHEKTGIEYLENESLKKYFGAIQREIVKPRLKKHAKQRDKIFSPMKQLVSLSHTHFIKYDTTPKIDNYFSKEGYFKLITSQLYDVFERDALFGGIEYGKYIKVLENLIGTGLKHIAYCSCLLEKHPNINLRNIVCIFYRIEDLIPQYAEYLKLSDVEVKQIFECFTVNEKNITYHLRDQKSFSPIFIKVSRTHVMRSVYGSNNNPLMFLMRELKRRFEKDFHNNTDREKVFRNQLYDQIKKKSTDKNALVCIDKEVNIRIQGLETDIDAIIYDTGTKNLALFQLKWQMFFAHDLSERRNKLSELKKAEKWVEKIKTWSKTLTDKEILSSLNILPQLSNKNKEINEVFIFVIARYNAHFTGFSPAGGAAWSSWFLLLEILDNVKGKLGNPLNDLFFKLQQESPLKKASQNRIPNYELDLGTYRIFYKNEIRK